MPFIVHSSLAFPSHYYSQDDLIKKLKEVWGEKFFNFKRIEDFHQNVQVEGRFLALALEDYKNLTHFKKRNDLWIKIATDLSLQAVKQLLYEVDFNPQEISLMMSNTITGFAVPSLEAKLMNALPFSRNTKRIPLFGLGCLAGVAGLNRVCDYLIGHPQEAAIFFSVELCSLTIQFDDFSIPNLISTGLFGDGAAAILVVGDQHPLALKAPLHWLGGESLFFPNTERVMGWDLVDSGLKIVLNKDVPQIVEEHIPTFLEEFLKKKNLHQSDLKFFLAHPGGPKVLLSLEKVLKLEQGELSPTWDNLKKHGNMSSVSVLSVLDDFLRRPRGKIQKDQKKGQQFGIMLAMGPAFSAELALLKHQF